MIKNINIELINDTYNKITNVYKHLQDEESKFLFFCRIGYAMQPNQEEWMQQVGNHYNDWKIEEIIEINKHRLVLYGAGHDGEIMLNILRHLGISPLCFCVSRLEEENVNGAIPILCVDDVIEKYKDPFYIVCSSLYKNDIKNELIIRGVEEKNIYIPKFKFPTIIRGKQYFDIFTPEKNEVFIDAGGYDGGTTRDFINWCGSEFGKAYVLEPIKSMYKKIANDFIDDKRIQVINGAAWNTEENLLFKEDCNNMAGSSVQKTGDVMVKGMKLDNIANQRISFIKMDIEGSELNALKGAEEVIKRDCPKLAICIYHKPWDVIEIAEYIIKLVPNYKLYIRQYEYYSGETVLYAIV